MRPVRHNVGEDIGVVDLRFDSGVQECGPPLAANRTTIRTNRIAICNGSIRTNFRRPGFDSIRREP